MEKCYYIPSFLDGKSGRPIRILSELLEPESRFKKYNINNTIVFFGSARILSKEAALKNYENSKNLSKEEIIAAEKKLEIAEYYEKACSLASKLANWSKNKETHSEKHYVVTGGGHGIMEAANKGAFLAGEHSIGLNIELPFEQEANKYITPDLLFYFNYFFMRKFWFSFLGRALVIFPGGFGTMDEMFELFTLKQTGKVNKNLPIVIFGKEFFGKLFNFDVLDEYGLISKNDTSSFYMTSDVDDAFDFLTKNLLINNSVNE